MKFSKVNLKAILFGNKSKVVLLMFFVGVIGLFSFTDSIIEAPFSRYFSDIEETDKHLFDVDIVENNELNLVNSNGELEEESEMIRICRSGVRTIPFNDPGPTTNYPFHLRSAIAVQSLDGNCKQGQVPCAFWGSVFVATQNGQSGDYRIITNSFGTIDLPNVSGVDSWTFGTPQNPLLLTCSFFEDFIVQAKNPTTGQWNFVRRFRLICNPCPADPGPTGV